MPEQSQSTLPPQSQEGISPCPLLNMSHNIGRRTRGRVPADVCDCEIPCITLLINGDRISSEMPTSIRWKCLIAAGLLEIVPAC